MVKVNLHGDLGEKIGSEWNLDVNSVSEAIRAIEANTGKLMKHLIQQAESEAKYEIFINNRPLWVPNAGDLPKKNKDFSFKHIDQLKNSEMNIMFSNDKLSSIDIIPVIEGAGGGGGGGGGCFPAGTKILTNEGLKNIEDFKKGDKILCFDKEKNIKESIVEETFFHKNNKILKVTLWGGKIIRATENHWFLNENNRFAPLSAFNVGDVLIHQSGDVLPIEKIEEDGYEDVYNMHVTEYHTYIAEEILVHNGGGGKGGKGGGGVFKGIFAVFLAIVLGAVTYGVGGTALLGTFMPAILGLVAVGVSLVLAKPPPMVSPAAIANPSADFTGSPTSGGEPSYLFGGPVNTVGEGGPIPVGYGRLIIGSHQVFASYDQLYRIQSRQSHLVSPGKGIKNAGRPKLDAGQFSFPTQSFYFDTRGYPVKILNIRGEDMSVTSLTSN